MARAVEPDPCDQLAGAFPQTSARDSARARQAPERPSSRLDLPVAVQPRSDVVVNRVVRKNAGALKRADQAETGDLVRLQSVASRVPRYASRRRWSDPGSR